MKATFTDEQLMLRDAAREMLEARYPIARVSELADGDGFERRAWREIAELGWTAIAVPEDLGGIGLSLVDEAVLAEELGRHLFPGPFLASVVLATSAAAGHGDTVERLASGDAIGTLAWGGATGSLGAEVAAIRAEQVGSGWALTGTASFVPDLALAHVAVVAAGCDAGTGLFLVELDASGTEISNDDPLDPTRTLGRLDLNLAAARLLAEPGAATEAILTRVRDRACVILAAECAGIMGRVLEISVEHATNREQYGRPIGSFQAVAHRLAQTYVDLESARSLAYWAAWSVSEGTPDATIAAASAKAFAADAAIRATQSAIQVHGGVGFTWEHPLHRFYRRALWCAAYMGWPATHRARVASALLDEGERA